MRQTSEMNLSPSKRVMPVLVALGAMLAAGTLPAQTPGEVPFSTGGSGRQASLQDTDGKVIYERICQGCHMADGSGGKQSPGVYPAVASNPKLAAKAYPAVLVVNGLGAMPSFGTMLSDEQIAAVVNYLRTSFGNRYGDAMAAAEVKALRPLAQARPTELRGR